MPYHIIYIIIIDEHRTTNNNNKLSLILYYLGILGAPALSVKLLGGGPGPFGPGESAPMVQTPAIYLQLRKMASGVGLGHLCMCSENVNILIFL